MQYFTEQGTSHREVKQKIQEKYGDSAKILSHRSIRIGGFLGLFTKEGVEISGYISTEEAQRKQRLLMEEKNRIITAAAAYQGGTPVPAPGPGESGGGSPRGAGAESRADSPADSLTGSGPGTSAGGGRKNTGTAAPADINLVLKELKEIKEKVSRQEAGGAGEEHPNLERMETLLAENDFSYPLIKEFLNRLKNELPLSALDDFEEVQHRVAGWICDKIEIYQDIDKPGKRRIILIGPTGVGKTTTIAKLAAMSVINNEGSGKIIRMITIDNYRIGAMGQLETYGDILNIPVAAVDTRDDMKKKVDLFSDADVIFVDTTGRCPRDYKNIAAMREVLEPCGGKAEYYLAVSATTKASDVREILKEFESFGYNALVLTKLDETQRIGNIISVLSELAKPLAYITFGQGVPSDIERATKTRLIKNLEGFDINIEKLKDEKYVEINR